MKAKAFSPVSLLLVLGAFIILMLSPAQAAESARKGLNICAMVIIPSLLPFFVFSGLISGLGVPRLLSRAAEPVMRGVFGVSGVCCTPFILGLTGGYPVGAAAVAQLVRDGNISSAEGERLLPFCNNTGPAFIMGAAGSGVFGSSGCGLLLYISHIVAAFAVGILFSPRKKVEISRPEPVYQVKSLAEVLPESVRAAVSSTVNICGFVIFFSVLTGLLDAVGLFSSIAGALAAHFGAELHFTRSLLTGFLELGSGIGAMAGLKATPANLALASFILGFGGLSVHCQTLSVIEGANMKCARHLAGRILHGCISAVFTFVAAMLLRN